MNKGIIDKHSGKIILLLFIGAMYLSYLDNKSNSKYKYIVKSDNIDHRSTAYSHTNVINDNGCISTTKGYICGTFRIIINNSNKYYKTEDWNE